MSRVVAHTFPAIFACAVVGPLTWWALDRDPKIIGVEGKVIDTEHAVPGGTLTVEWHIQKFEVCEGVAQNILTDSAGRRHISSERSSRTSLRVGALSARFDYDIPKTAAPGRAVLSTIMFQHCNPLQHYWSVQITVPDIVFQIKDPGCPTTQTCP